MLTFGMIGGGRGAFIGAVHRMAAQLDHEATFVAGALSSTPDKAIASGEDLGLAEDRNYPTWQAMLEGELARPEDDRIDYVSIVTPNHVHYETAKAFAEAGIHVVCDKPLVIENEQAADLVETVGRTGVVFAVTYNYTGYPMVREARARIAAGEIGAVRKVFVEYHQGWLATALESTGQKQAEWRTDPKLAGAGAVGDIGSHAENLVATMTGLEIGSLLADVNTFVEGRPIDDDAAVLLKFDGGARGVLTCSQVCVGEENGLAIRIYGERGAIKWKQENPNELWMQTDGEALRLVTRGGPGATTEEAGRATRIPAGHPEGFIEAFANVYRGAHAGIRSVRSGGPTMDADWPYPTVQDGARGVQFINAVLASKGSWTVLG